MKLAILILITLLLTSLVKAQTTPDISSSYSWQPVRVGAGGWATGVIVSPRDPNVRYVKDDTHQAYRWDPTRPSGGEWMPMIVHHADGSGFRPQDVPMPISVSSIWAIALDPSNDQTVYLSCTFQTWNTGKTGLFKSTDGGRNFVAPTLDLPKEAFQDSERLSNPLVVDPANGRVLYFGTPRDGLLRSTDGAMSWSVVSGKGAPEVGQWADELKFCPHAGTTEVDGMKVSRRLVIHISKTTEEKQDASGKKVQTKSDLPGNDILQTEDGSKTWTNLCAGTELAGGAGGFDIFPDTGAILATAPKDKEVWFYADGKWSNQKTKLDWEMSRPVIDPTKTRRVFLMVPGGDIVRSTDGGKTWTKLKREIVNQLGFAGTVKEGWMGIGPGPVFDQTGELWLANGNWGMLRYKPLDDDSETAVKWTVDCRGIENLCAKEIIIPKGGNGLTLVAAMDEAGMVLRGLDTFDVTRIDVNAAALSCGGNVAVCPNDLDVMVITSMDIFGTGYMSGKQKGPKAKCHDAISTDGGKTWKQFRSFAELPDYLFLGNIAISKRGNWSKGEDHLVWMPRSVNSDPPPTVNYSKDGGKTWKETRSFDGVKVQFGYEVDYTRYLSADPFTPDRFYLKPQSGGLWISTDGGETWTKKSEKPGGGSLAVNEALEGDLWVSSTWNMKPNPQYNGLFHSADGGATWTKVPGPLLASGVALGKGRGKLGDALYTAYFYGTMAGDDQPGVFRSTDSGHIWHRVSYYPNGLFVQEPTHNWSLAASWDEFGVIAMNTGGQGWVYGKPR